MTKSALFLASVLFILYSCSSKFILGEKYVYKEDSKRTLSLNFINDSLCVIKNIYTGEENEAKQIDYTCRYSILSKDYVLLVNSGEMIDTTGEGFFLFPSNYGDTSVVKQENNGVSIIPNYSRNNYKNLKVPYVGYDTLIINNKTIAWIKKDRSNKVVGYYKFKSD